MPSRSKTYIEAHQCVCTECGGLFTSTHRNAKTCSVAHRQARSRRFKRNPDDLDFNIIAGPAAEAAHLARDAAISDLPAVAREVLAEELRPAMREALSGDVLHALDGLMNLIPLANAALEETLRAVVPVYNEDGTAQYDAEGRAVVTADHAERRQAAALILKHTVGQSGLAPQPETPAQAPVIINFPEGMAPHLGPGADVDASGHELLELAEGENQCDTCGEVKLLREFVAGSDRCFRCHTENREKLDARIVAATGAGANA